MLAFPYHALARLIDIAGRLRNRPGFSATVDLLHALFVEVLEYEPARIDVLERLKFPPSAAISAAWSIAVGGGIRVCVLDHGNDVYHASTYASVFQVWQECLLFVVSRVTGKVRIVLREVSGNKQHIKRALTPIWMFGPRSDATASWAIRLGLLYPNPAQRSYARYRDMIEVLTMRADALLEVCDPYTWELRHLWMQSLDHALWHTQLQHCVEHFLQSNQVVVPGLHEALLRSFPAYLANTDYWLNYHSFQVHEAADHYDIAVDCGIYYRGHSLTVPIESLVIHLELPRPTSEGAFQLHHAEWLFVPRMSTPSSHQEPIELDEVDDLDDIDQADEHDQTLLESVTPSEEDLRLLSDSEDLSPDLISPLDAPFNEAIPERLEDTGERVIAPFLLLSHALCYGASGRLLSLHRRLRKLATTREKILEDVTKCIQRWQQTRYAMGNLGQNRSMLRKFFLEDFCERLDPNAPPLSSIGYQLRAQAVMLDSESMPEWACPIASRPLEQRASPMSETICHPIRNGFVYPAQPTSPYAALALPLGQQLAPEYARYGLQVTALKHHHRLSRIAVVPGPAPKMVLSNRWLKSQRAPTIRQSISENLLSGVPLETAPRGRIRRSEKVEDEEGKTHIRSFFVPDRALDPATGFVRPGMFVKPGKALAARQVSTRKRSSSTVEQRLLGAVFFERKHPLALRKQDCTWYCPDELEGVVETVRFSELDPTEAGKLIIDLRARLVPRQGDWLVASFGIGARLSAVVEVADLPYTEEGEPVDALFTVPEALWEALGRRATSDIVFAPDSGELLEPALILEDEVIAVGHRREAMAFDGEQQLNVFGQPLRRSHLPLFPMFALAPQLAAFGALRSLDALNSGGRKPRKVTREIEHRLSQLLRGLGLDASFRVPGKMECQPVTLDADFGPELEKPWETLSSRLGRPQEGGLCHPAAFMVAASQRSMTGVGDANNDEPASAQGRGRNPRPSRDSITVGVLRLPEPVLNPLAEEAVAELLGVTQEQLVELLAGEQRLEIGPGGLSADDWRIQPNHDLPMWQAPDPGLTGACAVRTLLEHRALRDPRAEILLESIWERIPILPPHWRPLLTSRTSLWFSSDLNHLYLDLVHRAACLERLLHRRGSLNISITLARGLLRENLLQLIGPTRKVIPRQLQTRHLPDDGGITEYRTILDRLSRELHLNMQVSSLEPLEYSLIAPWCISEDPSGRVMIPQSLLLRCWKKELAEHMLERHPRMHLTRALRAIEQCEPEAIKRLHEYVQGRGCAGYVLTPAGAVVPLEVVPHASQNITIPGSMARALELACDKPLLVYLPPDDEAQRETQVIARRYAMSALFGLNSDLYSLVMRRWGHLVVEMPDCGHTVRIKRDDSLSRVELAGREHTHACMLRSPATCEARTGVCARCLGLTPDSTAPVPLGMNVAAWLLRQFVRWPAPLQARVTQAIREDRIRKLSEVFRLVGEHSDAPLDTRPLEAVVRLRSKTHRSTFLHLWQLETVDTVKHLATSGGELRTDDFLSRLILRASHLHPLVELEPFLADDSPDAVVEQTPDEQILHEQPIADSYTPLQVSPEKDVIHSIASLNSVFSATDENEPIRESNESGDGFGETGLIMHPTDTRTPTHSPHEKTRTGFMHDELVIVGAWSETLNRLFAPFIRKECPVTPHQSNAQSNAQSIATEVASEPDLGTDQCDQQHSETIVAQPAQEPNATSLAEPALPTWKHGAGEPVAIICTLEQLLASPGESSSENSGTGSDALAGSTLIPRALWRSVDKVDWSPKSNVASEGLQGTGMRRGPFPVARGTQPRKEAVKREREPNTAPILVSESTHPRPEVGLPLPTLRPQPVEVFTPAMNQGETIILPSTEENEALRAELGVVTAETYTEPASFSTEASESDVAPAIAVSEELPPCSEGSIPHNAEPIPPPKPSVQQAYIPARLIITRNGTLGREFRLAQSEVSIGRFDMDLGSFPDIDLEDEDMFNRISAHHCIVRWESGCWVLRDIGSTHGTSHNRAKRLPHDQPVALADGDELIIGKLFLKFQLDQGVCP